MTEIISILSLLAITFLYISKDFNLAKAVSLLERQRNRALYPMDEQLKTQREIAEFIKNHG